MRERNPPLTVSFSSPVFPPHLMLVGEGTARVWANGPIEPCGGFFIKCSGSSLFITLAVGPPLITDLREMTIVASQLKLDLF